MSCSRILKSYTRKVNLQTIKEMLEEVHETREKTEDYQPWKRELNSEPNFSVLVFNPIFSFQPFNFFFNIRLEEMREKLERKKTAQQKEINNGWAVAVS